MNIFIAIVGLALLILVHEAGHFVAAKAVGLRATKFYIGFPPAIVKFRRGDTEYGIGAIFLGGYVRIVGMMRPRGRDLAVFGEAVEEARRARPPGEPDDLGAAWATLCTALDSDESAALPRLADRLAAALRADRDYIEPERYAWCEREIERLQEDVHPGAYWRAATWRRITAIVAGPAANLVAAIVILTLYFGSGVPVFDNSTGVHSVASGTPAAQAGLKAGDTIVAVDGAKVATAEGIRAKIVDGGPVRLTVEREGRTLELPPATPKRIDTCASCLGFGFGIQRTGTRDYTPAGAVSAAFSDIRFVTTETFKALRRTILGERENLTTPVGIVDQSADYVDTGVYPRLLALISLSLAIFNMLPFLPLDGGHVLFALIEKLRRRPVRREVYERVSAIGIAAMLVVFFIGLTNDVGRITGPGPTP